MDEVTRSIDEYVALMRQTLASLGLPADVIVACADAAVRGTDSAAVALTRAWDTAIEMSGDDAIPLRCGTQVPFGTYQVVDYLAAACATLGDSWVQLARYFSIIAPPQCWQIDARSNPRRVWLRRNPNHIDPTPRPTRTHHYFTQYSLGVTISRLHSETREPMVFEKVDLEVPAPRDDAAYQQLFGCDVNFDQPHNMLSFSERTWAISLRRPAHGLKRALQQHLDELLAQQATSDSPLIAVRLAVREALPQGPPRLGDVASRCAMSERTLQRRLGEAGTSFQKLLDEERHQAALQHTQNRTLSVGDIAYLLGYSESSAFVRAFKRWTGSTPKAFRQRSTAVGAS